MSDTSHFDTLGNLELRAIPGRDWAILSRHHNGTRNSIGFTFADLADAAALLQTAVDWLAGQYGDPG